MQHGYVYYRAEPIGRNFAPEFRPELTPKQMLALGVFGGKYMTDCRAEFPASWFARAKLCSERHDPRAEKDGKRRSEHQQNEQQEGHGRAHLCCATHAFHRFAAAMKLRNRV